MKTNYSLRSVGVGQVYSGFASVGYVQPLSAIGFEKEYHEIQYYARLNRKGKCCLNHLAVEASIWSLVLAQAVRKDKRLSPLCREDVRCNDVFAGDHDTSYDAVYFLLRNVMTSPVFG